MKIRLVLPFALMMMAATPVLAQHHGSHAPSSKQATDAPARLVVADFDKLDADKDGHVTPAELPGEHPLRAHFSMADKNRDGKLDPSEFGALVEMQ